VHVDQHLHLGIFSAYFFRLCRKKYLLLPLPHQVIHETTENKKWLVPFDALPLFSEMGKTSVSGRASAIALRSQPFTPLPSFAW
jgi:hypothetical protein